MTDTPCSGPSPDGIYAEARTKGAALAAAAAALGDDGPPVRIPLTDCSIVTLWSDSVGIGSNDGTTSITPRELTMLAGLLMGFADFYGTQKGRGA